MTSVKMTAAILGASLLVNIFQAIQANRNEMNVEVGRQVLLTMRDQKELLAKTPQSQLLATERLLGDGWVKAVRNSVIPK